jgi:ABC-type transport system involved in multi-copper enzyme maturation permease subunit
VSLGTDPYFALDHPGLFDPPVEPDPPERWIDEDGPSFGEANSTDESATFGFDDDGDCTGADVPERSKDSNGNGVACDIVLRSTYSGASYLLTDGAVDEDPSEAELLPEVTHRAFLLGYGKLGLVFIVGIFVPLFLASGLVRTEISSGTMHYMLAKPIARGEVLLYRMLGYLALVWPVSAALVLISALVTGLAAPGEGWLRVSDLGLWLAMLLATWLALLVYGMLFMTLGVMWRFGIVLALPFAAWEFGLAFLSMNNPSSPLLRVSVIGWCLSIIDAATRLVWKDHDLFVAYTSDGAYWGPSGPPGEALAILTSDAPFAVSPTWNIAIAVLVLLMQAGLVWLVGAAMFNGKEIA